MTAPARTVLGRASLASDWWVDVLIDGVWVALNGITQFQPATPVTTESIVPLNTDGWDFPVKQSMAWSLQITVTRKPTKDAVPVYDVGQEALRDAADDDWGTIALRWYKMDTVRAEAYTGTGIVEYAPSGGGVGAMDEAAIQITGQGARTRINHPSVV